MDAVPNNEILTENTDERSCDNQAISVGTLVDRVP